ncbi:MAG: type II toxin-antitoxin system Phd/YefM family antitoxin [Candidatus Eremiobacterota bacterium]
MEQTIGISECKARCIAILKEIQRTRTPLVVTHRGKPVACIEPVGDRPRRSLGALSHLCTIQGDLVHWDFPDEWEMEHNQA